MLETRVVRVFLFLLWLVSCFRDVGERACYFSVMADVAWFFCSCGGGAHVFAVMAGEVGACCFCCCGWGMHFSACDEVSGGEVSLLGRGPGSVTYWPAWGSL